MDIYKISINERSVNLNVNLANRLCTEGCEHTAMLANYQSSVCLLGQCYGLNPVPSIVLVGTPAFPSKSKRIQAHRGAPERQFLGSFGQLMDSLN